MDSSALAIRTALAGALALGPLVVRAQTAATPAAPATEVKEVVVTATRRTESVLKIPYNISAISGDELKNNGVTSLASLRNSVVGLQASDFGERGANTNNAFVIRGITTNDPVVGEAEYGNLAAPTVSNYIDETPLFVNLKLTDIDRVEVLRGPQGTLFGADSEGGTVRTIHNKPDPKGFDASLDMTMSGTVRADQPNSDIDGMINIPLTPRLAVRVDAGYEHLAGFIDATNAVQFNQGGVFLPMTAQPVLSDPSHFLTSGFVTRTLHDINYSHLWYARADALWKATDRFTAEVTYQHQESFANAFSLEYPGTDYVTLQRLPVVPSQTNTDIAAVTLTGDFGFGTITSSSSYYNVGTHDINDNSGIDVNYPYYYGAYPRITTPNYDFNRDDAFTQEIRLVSPTGGFLDYIIGGYYQNRRSRAYSIETVPGFATWARRLGSGGPGYPTFADQIVQYYGGTRPGSLTPRDLSYDYLRNVQFTDLAAFGEVTAHLTSRWRITGGARLFKETFAQTSIQHLYNAGTTFGADSLGTSQGMGEEHSYSALFKANMAYDLTPHTLAYFTFSQGYRPAGANAYPIGSCAFCNDASFETFGSDRTDNFELGIKGRMGRLQYSADVYQIDWRNVQLEVTSNAGTAIVINGNDARSRGVELEAHYALGESLKLSAGYAYTDAALSSDFSVDGGLFSGTSGTPLPGISRHQINGGIDYSPTALSAHEVTFHIDGSYRSSFNNQIETNLPSFVRLSGFALLNAYAQAKVGAHTTVQVFAENLLDAKGVTSYSALTPGGLAAAYREAYSFDRTESVTRPLTVGLRVVVRR